MSSGNRERRRRKSSRIAPQWRPDALLDEQRFRSHEVQDRYWLRVGPPLVAPMRTGSVVRRPHVWGPCRRVLEAFGELAHTLGCDGHTGLDHSTPASPAERTPYAQITTSRSGKTSTRMPGRPSIRRLSRSFPALETGKIAVKVINHGEEFMQVYDVSPELIKSDVGPLFRSAAPCSVSGSGVWL
jgi:hypothetical protein